MTTDCFGNPTPGIPPSISDTFHAIHTYSVVPLEYRMKYHYARTDLMIGRGDSDLAWGMFRKMNLMVRAASRDAS